MPTKVGYDAGRHDTVTADRFKRVFEKGTGCFRPKLVIAKNDSLSDRPE